MQQMNLENQAVDWSTDVGALVLSANTAESITVPADARFVVMSGTADFYALYGADPTAAAPVVTATPDAATAVANPAVRKVQPGKKISVISASACIVTFEFFK